MVIEDRVRKCLVTDDKTKVLGCIESEIKGNKEIECAPRLVLLYLDGCGGCEEAKKQFADKIASGVITPVNIHTEEGLKIAQANGVSAVPALLILDCSNNAIRPEEK